ncbi:MAG: hypothetical protein JHD16_13635 [Solirubrobacteraceae bacterium]|nr:hypothetical protein [Solirubrobacteraceae bacterium]
MLPASRPSLAPRARRAAVLLLAAAATGGLAACSTDNNAQTDDLPGARGEVQDAIKRLADLADRDDGTAICRELLSPTLRTALGDAQCAKNVETAIKASDYTSLNVDSVTVDAAETTAVAQIKPVEDADARRSVTLTRKTKSDPWTILALDPTGKTKLPAGSTPAGTTPAETTPAASTPKS